MLSRFALLGGLVIASVVTLSTVSAEAHTTGFMYVKDARGNIVHSTNGNCVLTHWEGNNGNCDGEVKEITLEERTVYFNFNDTTLTDEDKSKLDSLAEILKSRSEIKSISIVGYADRVGSVAYNEKLSKKRALTVKDYLAAQGYLNANVTKTRWVGKSKPTAACAGKLKKPDLIACLAPDRKVEIEVNYVGAKSPMVHSWRAKPAKLATLAAKHMKKKVATPAAVAPAPAK